ncbi:hypothetical protein GF415_04280 [Candidatus Micrarchaeota archaeon]|nr:hypothetical protein [Candidatus Micrarchaeota archaeon]
MSLKITAISKTGKRERLGTRARRAVFRNIRPLGIFSSAAIAAGFFATGALHPGIAMGPLAFTSLHTALNSFSTAGMLKESRRPLSAMRLVNTGAIDSLSAITCISQVIESGGMDVKRGIVIGAMSFGLSLWAHFRERGNTLINLREKFNDPFQNMESVECSTYLKIMEKRERAWHMQPYWVLRPEKFLEIQDEKGKVARYLFTKKACADRMKEF